MVLATAPATAAPVTSLTIYYTDRPPYAITEGQTGLLLDRAKLVLAEAGLKGRFIELPADRIAALLRAGPVDALALGWTRTPEREEWGHFSGPLYVESPPVAVFPPRLAGTWGTPTHLEALLGSGLTLGTKAGIPLPPTLERKIRAEGLVPLETTVDVPGLLRMVAQGRMDYTFLPEEEVRYHLSRDPSLAAQLAFDRLADPPSGSPRLLFYANGFDPALQQKLDAAVEKLRS